MRMVMSIVGKTSSNQAEKDLIISLDYLDPWLKVLLFIIRSNNQNYIY